VTATYSLDEINAGYQDMHAGRNQGDRAVQVTTQTWTAKSTGRSATVDVAELFVVTDGLISEIRVFQQDTHALLATLD
jgi:uncharacterized protein